MHSCVYKWTSSPDGPREQRLKCLPQHVVVYTDALLTPKETTQQSRKQGGGGDDGSEPDKVGEAERGVNSQRKGGERILKQAGDASLSLREK